MLAIFPIQDWFGIDESIRKEDYKSERINNPANPENRWNYRMHVTLEELIKQTAFAQHIQEMITEHRPHDE